MLTRMLGRHSDRYAFTGEGTFFERLCELREIEAAETRRKKVAQVITHSGGPPVSEVLRHIRRRTTGPGSPVSDYLAGKNGIAQENDASGWVQKATSYAFYISDILGAVPDARCIFLVRNPLDISASLKRRELKNGWTRMIWGWNWGVRQARAMSAHHPNHVRIVRYEDLVTETTDTFRKICSFCDLSYQQRCVEVPHVNRSETPYNQESEAKGVDDSRVYYFRSVLRPEEQATVKRLADTESLRALYSDLPDKETEATLWGGIETVKVLARGGLDLVESQVKGAIANPRWTWERIRRRISG